MLAPAHAGDDDESAADRRRFAWTAALVFMALTAPRLFAHELWRDEAWQWLVVVESRSLGELFTGMSRGGGSGYLVPILYFLARQVSTSPLVMQAVHLLMASAAAFAFARWAPLPRRERALFVLGYFPFFEYAVISRSYAMGALLVWLACAATRSRRPALALGAALGLLCQTTVYGYILAITLACGWLFDRWLRRRELPTLPPAEIAGALLFAGSGAVAGIVQLIQAPETNTAKFDFGWHLPHAHRVATIPWRAFVPLPLPEVQFWNTSILDPWPWLQGLAGALTLVLAFALLWRRRVAMLTFAIGTIGLLTFSYAFVRGSARHHGHLWLLFFAALWLGGSFGFAGVRSSWRHHVLLALMVVHATAGAFASWVDLRHPFSNGAATAALIRRQGLDRYPLLGHREPPAATVALYLGQPLYAPSRQAFVTRPDWGPRQRELTEPELRCAARDFARQQGRDVVLVLNRALPAWRELEAAGSTSGAIVATEDYQLAWLRRARLAATAADAGCPGEGAAGPAGAGAAL